MTFGGKADACSSSRVLAPLRHLLSSPPSDWAYLYTCSLVLRFSPLVTTGFYLDA